MHSECIQNWHSVKVNIWSDQISFIRHSQLYQLRCCRTVYKSLFYISKQSDLLHQWDWWLWASLHFDEVQKENIWTYTWSSTSQWISSDIQLNIDLTVYITSYQTSQDLYFSLFKMSAESDKMTCFIQLTTSDINVSNFISYHYHELYTDVVVRYSEQIWQSTYSNW